MTWLDCLKALAWFLAMAGCFTAAAAGVYLCWRICRD